MTEKVLNEEDLEMTSGGQNDNPNFNEDEINFYYIYYNRLGQMRCPHCHAVCAEFDTNSGSSIFRCKSCGWIDWADAFRREDN